MAKGYTSTAINSTIMIHKCRVGVAKLIRRLHNRQPQNVVYMKDPYKMYTTQEWPGDEATLFFRLGTKLIFFEKKNTICSLGVAYLRSLVCHVTTNSAIPFPFQYLNYVYINIISQPA